MYISVWAVEGTVEEVNSATIVYLLRMNGPILLPFFDNTVNTTRSSHTRAARPLTASSPGAMEAPYLSNDEEKTPRAARTVRNRNGTKRNEIG